MLHFVQVTDHGYRLTMLGGCSQSRARLARSLRQFRIHAERDSCSSDEACFQRSLSASVVRMRTDLSIGASSSFATGAIVGLIVSATFLIAAIMFEAFMSSLVRIFI